MVTFNIVEEVFSIDAVYCVLSGFLFMVVVSVVASFIEKFDRTNLIVERLFQLQSMSV